ncbi:hypothetical protein [Nodosilinea sp. P-1105]|uniref:hypothetical protein n=1 Tax=Nodosilinea sp. P-1105 TaxID=2546229 RepID=UPI00146F269C|nr:hypothetical protein [Nodosilinea sp. P-1105]
MDDITNYEKLASVFNRAAQQGKNGFCKMLWGNQPEGVQTQLKPLLTSETLNVLATDD